MGQVKTCRKWLEAPYTISQENLTSVYQSSSIQNLQKIALFLVLEQFTINESFHVGVYVCIHETIKDLCLAKCFKHLRGIQTFAGTLYTFTLTYAVGHFA